VIKTNSRSSVLNIATHKKIFLMPVSAAATTDRRVPPLPLSPSRERERGEAARRERGTGARERGGHRSEQEGGRREERRRLWAAVPVRCHCHRPAPMLVVDGGAGRAHGGRASGARAGGGAHADLALGWRRDEAGARLVSRAGAEWGGGARADLALGQRREEAETRSFFSSALVRSGGEKGMPRRPRD
jgi:hypothetical protein